MTVRLMTPDRDFDLASPLPPHEPELTADLGLTTLWAAMAEGDRYLWDVARVVTLRGCLDPATIRYRQEVLSDFRSHPEVARELYVISSEATVGKKRIHGMLRRTPTSTLRHSVDALKVLVGHLRRLREVAAAHDGTWHSAGARRFFATVLAQLDDGYFAQIERHLTLLRFKDGQWMSAQLAQGNRGTAYTLRVPSDVRARRQRRFRTTDHRAYAFDVHPRDEAGLEALGDLRDRATNLVANALAQSTDRIAAYFTQLRTEVAFFVACLNVERRLEAAGVPTCRPEPVGLQPAPILSARGLYDGVLALRTCGRVIGNDLHADGRTLVMITGANSGGKSTFLRSIGLSHLQLQCGMHVCAERYRASVCDGLFTHFAREEDVTMRSGRFDEELGRMSRITRQLSPHSMLLCNESFTGTSEWEGSEIARQVVRALVGHGVRVVFVTHLYDLAQSLYEQATGPTLFLRAERLDDGSRSFRILEGAPLPTSYGPDLYERMGGWLPRPRRT